MAEAKPVSPTPLSLEDTTKSFLRTQPAFTTTENTPQALSDSLLNVCHWTGCQMLVWRADTPLFQRGQWSI